LAGSLTITACAGITAARSPAILALTSGPSLFVFNLFILNLYLNYI